MKDLLKVKKRNGFILQDALLSLCIAVILLPIIVTCLSVSINFLNTDHQYQDAIAISQLRRMFNVSRNYHFEGNELHFTYHNEEFYLKLSNGNLVLKPGTQFILVDIYSVSFQEENGCIKLFYEREKDEKEYTLTCIE